MMGIYMKHGLLRSPTSNNPNIPYYCFPKRSKPQVHYSRHRLHLVCGEGRSSNRTQWTNSDSGNTALRLNDSDSSSSSSSSPSSTSSPQALVWEAAHRLTPKFHAIDQLIYHNQGKVQKAMQKFKIGPHHFSGSTGYGHGDLGRAALDDIVADIMGAEAAAVRIQFVSGTHAIASALFGCLRPGDELLAIAGKPYDTLEEVIGIRQGSSNDNDIGSLADFGIHYRQLDLDSDGNIDWDVLSSKSKALQPKTKVALIQRSCGYALRPTLTIADIQKAVSILKSHNPNIIIAVDNCYGEFTETLEPCNVGADICMGSFIKNPGGTIVTGGGYVAGRADLVRRAVARLTAPGVGMDAGCVPGETMRLMFQGLFLAPQMVGEALKGGRLVAEVLSAEGMSVYPPLQKIRDDDDDASITPPSPSSASSPLSLPLYSFITAIELGSRDKMIAFCEAVQRCSPIGSYVLPVPGVTPGYSDEVIFADGTFIDGSTSELSADGPIRPPYVVYCQGGTHWTHWARVLEGAVDAMRKT